MASIKTPARVFEKGAGGVDDRVRSGGGYTLYVQAVYLPPHPDGVPVFPTAYKKLNAPLFASHKVAPVCRSHVILRKGGT